MIPEKDRYKGQLAYIGLAAGRKHKGYILDDLVFTTGVAECILPAGRVVDKLGLMVYPSSEQNVVVSSGHRETLRQDHRDH